MPPRSSFWRELKERHVIRVGLVYLAVAWALIEGAQVLTSILDLPEFTARLVFALVVLGFPVAIVLAWAFQVTPDGVRRAEPFAMRGRLNLPFLGGLALGIIAVTGPAFVFFGWGQGSHAGPIGHVLDSNTVVVMPFRVSAPEELSYLGAGFMDLLAARLDGEVGPRAVDPGAVVSAASRASHGARALAERLGAGLVLTGSIVGGPSGIVASAEYSDVADGSLRASASAAGHPDSLTAIADQLIIQLLSLSAGEYTTSIAALTSTSPGALKAYLRGKQAFRDGRYFEAINRFDEAIGQDSTFALAAIARADGATNALTIGSGGGLEQAWRHRDRLGARDLMYLEARLPQTPRTSAENIAAFERLIREQPDRVEAWYWLGEAVHHQAGVVHDEKWGERVRAVFERTLELDPRYFPAVDHLIFVELKFGTPEQLQAVAERVYHRPEGGNWAGIFRRLARGEGEFAFDVDSLPTMDANGLTLAAWWPIYGPDQTPADFVPWVDAALEEARRRAGIDLSLDRVLDYEYRLNIALGRPSRAEAVWEEFIRQGFGARHDRSTIYRALWSGVALDDAAAAVLAIDDRLAGPRDAVLSVEDARHLAATEAWRFVRDAARADAAAAARIRAAAEAAPHPRALELEALALLVESWAQARSGDRRARASLDRLVAIILENPGGDLERSDFLRAVATVHEEMGDLRGALDRLDSVPWYTNSLYDVGIWREQGRLAALTGDTARAVREYQRYLKVRVAAEPALAAEVEAVRAELGRLQGAI